MGFYATGTRYYDPEISRFINADTTDILDVSGNLYDKNLYAYCDNNPVVRFDVTGCAWDVILDIGYIGWDIYDLIANDGYKDWKKWMALGLDVAFAVVPFATGGGQIIKLTDVGNKLHDLSKVTTVGETMTRVQTVSQFVNATDNLYDGFKAYNSLSKLGKGGKVLAEIGGKTSNLLWLYNKLRQGYTVVDIGIDLGRISKSGAFARSSSYIAESILLGAWKYRNIWKMLYHGSE